MKNLPAHVKPYRRTDVFDAATIPAGLLKSHRVAEDVWAKLCVLDGTLMYIIEEPLREEILLDSAKPGILEPGISHYVVPHEGVRFYVEFYQSTEA